MDCLDRGGRVGEGELRQRAQNLNLLERWNDFDFKNTKLSNIQKIS